jgi:hypothetical protein
MGVEVLEATDASHRRAHDQDVHRRRVVSARLPPIDRRGDEDTSTRD